MKWSLGQLKVNLCVNILRLVMNERCCLAIKKARPTWVIKYLIYMQSPNAEVSNAKGTVLAENGRRVLAKGRRGI